MRFFIFFICLFYFNFISSQENNSGISGNFDLKLQSYQEDNLIGAEKADEIILNNSYLNIFFTKNNFSAGFRYESYLNALLDYDEDYNGNGIPFRFATYSIDNLEVTGGNFYEQFGSGIIFRSYENKDLGIDNVMDGIKLIYNPFSGLYLKSFIGKSRTYFSYSDGIIRGIDAESNLNEMFNLSNSTIFIIGGSFVSRFQKDNNPKFKLPENVGLYATRVNFINSNLNFYTEYIHKFNDPVGSLTFEGNNYASGNALVSNLSYSQKGLGISAEIHRIDNMEFRSERQKSKEYIINYIPALSKQHSYSLLALNPCATQSEGEFGYQFDVFYKLKKGTILGGRYGTKINANYSRIIGLKGGGSYLNDSISFIPEFFGDKNNLFFSDFNFELIKKVSPKLKINSIISYQEYNKDVMEGKTIGEYGVVKSNIGIIDIIYKIKRKHSIRVELQSLISEGGDGDWSTGLIEYTISPNWFFAIQDMYNWGNVDDEKRLHYFNINMGYIKGGNRFEIGYGKKRAGIFCVGGVCKEVPSSNGFNINISSSF